MLIVNGRAPGNSGKEPTYVGSGKRVSQDSVVDYFLLPTTALPLILHLHVATPVPHFDHRALSLLLGLPPPPRAHQPVLAPDQPRYLLPSDPAERTTLVPVIAAALGDLSGLSALPPGEHVRVIRERLLMALTPYRCRPRRAGKGSPAKPGSSWFGRRERALCDTVRSLTRQLERQPPPTPAARQLLATRVATARKAYGQAVKRARREWKQRQARSFMGLLARDPARFWRSIHDRQLTSPACSSAEVGPHFTELLNPQTAPVQPVTLAAPRPLTEAQAARLAPLGDPFAEAEVAEGVQALHKGRAADEWGLQGETLQLLAEANTAGLTTLLNRFFREGLPAELGASVMLPIYKGKGSREDLNNFRGISILPILTKLYASLLERRLAGALEGAGLRADTQFGFRKKRGTQDAAFVLQALLDTRGKGHRYLCFVDFRKAFDTVQRPVLWQLLRNLAVPEPFVLALESYYTSVSFRVRHPSGLSDPIAASIGVKQGCPLSPTLFGVFIESLLLDLLRDEHSATFALPELQGVPVPPLLYADDLALIATSLAGLQRQCDALTRWAARYGLSVNVAKTHALAVGLQSSRAGALRLRLGGEQVAWVDEFRYLGMQLHTSRGFVRAGEVLYAAAVDRHHAMWRRVRELGLGDADSLCTLFDSLVQSILGYGSPVWGPAVFCGSGLATEPSASSLALRIERLHRRFQRTLLGLPRLTSRYLLSLETQRPPLQAEFFKSALTFLHRVMAAPEDSVMGRALRASAAARERGATTWVGQLAQWAAAMGAPLDLTSIEPPRRRPAPRAGTAAAAAALHSATAGHARALQRWDARIRSAADDPAVDPFDRARLRQRLHLAPPGPWTRRPPPLYRSFPLRADRELVARSRLALATRDMSVWDAPDLFSDGGAAAPLLARRRWRPRVRLRLALCPHCQEGPRPVTISHALTCPLPGFVDLRAGVLRLTPPGLDLTSILRDPPRSWPSYLRSLSTLAQRLNSGDLSSCKLGPEL